MKVLFVGPSLPDAASIAGADFDVRPPACQGDVMKAIQDGATAIGLIDGQFEFVAPVWHKELLFALSKGLPVFGAASMGALRAAECAAYGMTGIGRIFDEYMAGKRIDDSDVALIHSPAELGYIAITVPLVNVDATLDNAFATEALSETQVDALAKAARKVFFKERTWKKMAELSQMDWDLLRVIVKTAGIDQKRQDAIALIDQMRTLEVAVAPVPDWQFNATPLWRKLYS